MSVWQRTNADNYVDVITDIHKHGRSCVNQSNLVVPRTAFCVELGHRPIGPTVPDSGAKSLEQNCASTDLGQRRRKRKNLTYFCVKWGARRGLQRPVASHSTRIEPFDVAILTWTDILSRWTFRLVGQFDPIGHFV